MTCYSISHIFIAECFRYIRTTKKYISGIICYSSDSSEAVVFEDLDFVHVLLLSLINNYRVVHKVVNAYVQDFSKLYLSILKRLCFSALISVNSYLRYVSKFSKFFLSKTFFLSEILNFVHEFHKFLKPPLYFYKRIILASSKISAIIKINTEYHSRFGRKSAFYDLIFCTLFYNPFILYPK